MAYVFGEQRFCSESLHGHLFAECKELEAKKSSHGRDILLDFC
jgi:hypothetical protein